MNSRSLPTIAFLAGLSLLFCSACDSSRTAGDASASDSGGRTDGQTGDGPAVDGRTDGPRSDVRVDAPPAGTAICDPQKATCRALPQPCGRGEVRSVDSGGCWGACVPIANCSDVPLYPDCDQTKISCERVSPVCPQHYTPTHENQCYGPCVPAVVCACKTGGPSSQCPSETPVCYNLDQRCGPLAP